MLETEGFRATIPPGAFQAAAEFELFALASANSHKQITLSNQVGATP